MTQQPDPAAEPGTQSEAETYQRLRAHLAFLKLTDAAEALPRVLDEAREQQLSLVGALEQLLAVEVAATEDRRLTSRLRFACLPAPWRLADFDYTAQPGIDEALIRELATLRFIDEGANVLFIGPPGVGKTMLAVGLARAGAEAGHRVYFTTAADLAARCHKAAIEGRWATMMRFYAGPRLLAIDELGYLPLAADAAAALFQVINTRYTNGSSTHHHHQRRHRLLGHRLRTTTRWSPPPCSTGSSTAASSSGSTDPPTGCAPTRPAPRRCAQEPR